MTAVWRHAQTTHSASLTCLVAECDHTAPALLLDVVGAQTARRAQYLFHVPENLARLLLEHAHRPTRHLRAAFAPAITPSVAGGLPSLLLRLCSDGHGAVRLLGPNGLPNYCHALRHIIRFTHPAVYVSDSALREAYADELGVHVYGVPFLPSTTTTFTSSSSSDDDEDSDDNSDDNNSSDDDDDARAQQPREAARAAAVPAARRRNTATTSTYQAAQLPFHFGVENRRTPPPLTPDDDGGGGALAGFFVRLDCVQRDDGKGVTFFVADVPSTSAPSGERVPAVREDDVALLSFVVHLAHGGARVAVAPEYLRWVASLPKSVSHIWVGRTPPVGECKDNDVGDALGFQTSACTQGCLTNVSAQAFPFAGWLPATPTEMVGDSVLRAGTHVRASLLWTLNLANFTWSFDDALNENQHRLMRTIADAKERLETKRRAESERETTRETNRAVAAALRKSLSKSVKENDEKDDDYNDNGKDRSDDDVHVAFLGTGCAEPSKYRAGSAIVVAMPKQDELHAPSSTTAAVLLDAGEGCYAAWLRLRDAPGQHVPDVSSLVALWISHHHADHVLGLPQILHQRAVSEGDPIHVAAPRGVAAWLRELPSRALGGALATTATVWSHDEFDRATNSRSGISSPLSSLGVAFASVQVDHCPGARAVVLRSTFRSTWSVAYSGDGRPSGTFARIARGVDLLIQESTFADELSAEATKKRHCTLTEAVGVSLACGARRTVFTHFSQRYPLHMPILDADATHVRDRCFFANDGLIVAFSEMSEMPRMQQYVACALGVEEESV